MMLRCIVSSVMMVCASRPTRGICFSERRSPQRRRVRSSAGHRSYLHAVQNLYPARHPGHLHPVHTSHQQPHCASGPRGLRSSPQSRKEAHMTSSKRIADAPDAPDYCPGSGGVWGVISQCPDCRATADGLHVSFPVSLTVPLHTPADGPQAQELLASIVRQNSDSLRRTNDELLEDWKQRAHHAEATVDLIRKSVLSALSSQYAPSDAQISRLLFPTDITVSRHLQP